MHQHSRECDTLLEREHRALKLAELAAERTAKLQAITSAFSQVRSPDHVIDVVMDQGLALQGAFAGSIAILSDDRAMLKIVRARGYPAEVLSTWQRIPIEAPVPLAEAVRTGEPIWLESLAQRLERYPNLSAPQFVVHMGVIAAVPLVARGQVIGSMGLSFTEDRQVDAEERAFIQTLANHCAQALDWARLYAAEQQARDQAQAAQAQMALLYNEAQAATRRQDEVLALVEALVQKAPIGFAFTDTDLRYQLINDILAEINGRPVAEHIGHTVREMIPHIAPLLEPYFHRVLATGEPVLGQEISESGPAGSSQSRHWLMNVYPVRTQVDQLLGIGVAVTDITKRRRAEDLRTVQFAVTRVLAQAENRAMAAPQLLKTIATAQGWDLGELWRVDTDRDCLCWENSWHVHDIDTRRFLAVSQATTLSRDSGLAGRAWTSGQPTWDSNIVGSSCPRAAFAVEAGFRAAMAFPICRGRDVQGVMVFLCRSKRMLGPHVLAVMADIGSQIGQFFERAQAEERLRRYAQRLKVVHMMDQAILAARSPAAIAQAAVHHILELVPCQHASVLAFDLPAGKVTIWAAHPNIPTNMSSQGSVSLEEIKDIDILNKGQSLLVTDVSKLAEPTGIYRLLWAGELRSYISVPIMWQGNLIGSLNLASNQAGVLNSDHLDIAQEVVDQLPVAIQNVQLVEQVQLGRERLKRLSQRLVAAQEDERRHIARELHDEIGQSLTAAQLNLQMLADPSAADVRQARVEDSMALIDAVLNQVRTLSLNLRPSMLDDLGLVPALRWYLNRQAERAGFAAEVVAEELQERFAPEIETACFRVVQEAVTNVTRYAKARHVVVEVRRVGAELHLVIQDDGVGFVVASAQQRAAGGYSMGLLSMYERVVLIGGQIEIESALGQGTTIRLRLPVELSPDGGPATERRARPR